MNFSKITIAFILFVTNVAAFGSRPGGSEAYLILTRSDYFRQQLVKKLGTADRATLKQRIKSAKFRAVLSKLMQSSNSNNSNSHQEKSTSRMNRFRRFHQ